MKEFEAYFEDLYPKLYAERKALVDEHLRRKSGKSEGDLIFKKHLEYPDRRVEDIAGIVVHHSAGEQGPLEIEKYHIEGRGYPGAMYHYIIHEGKVYRMNPIEKIVFHAGVWSYNKTHIGICFVGNYMNKSLDAENRIAFQILLSSLLMSIGDVEIIGHRDITATLCPGNKLYNFIKYINSRRK